MQRDRRPAKRALTMWLLWSQGWSHTAIGRAYGVSSTTVARILRPLGVRARQGLGARVGWN
jgi:DNA-binding transcriptional regulator LsrR (DeoR family)